MRETYLAICDEDQFYVDHLTDYFLQKKGFPFRLGTFHDVEALISYSKQNKIDLLLISEDFYEQCRDEVVCSHVVLFSDGMNTGKSELTEIYKYQSAEEILKELLMFLAKEEFVPKGKTGNQRTSLVTFYTPIGRCLQSTTAFTYAKMRAREEKILFVSLEPYSTLDYLCQRQINDNLTDLIYLSSGDKDKFSFRMSAMLQTMENLDILPPVQHLLDLQAVGEQDWKMFFDKMKSLMQYDAIVLDLGYEVQGFLGILAGSDQVFQIRREETSARIAIDRFEADLLAIGYPYLREQTQAILMPDLSIGSDGGNPLANLIETQILYPEKMKKKKTVSFIKELWEE